MFAEDAFRDHFPAGAVCVVEWNDREPYEGRGGAIAKVIGKSFVRFHAAEYGHCSCYGPAETMTDCGDHATFDQALASMSTDVREKLAALAEGM